MPRMLAIDYGTKRTGLAVTDPLQLIATPLDTIHSKDLLSFLQNYTQKEEVEGFVIGMPKKLNGEEALLKPAIIGLQRTLKKMFPAQTVELIDERFSSVMAIQALKLQGAKRKDLDTKEGNIDKVSATILLQDYLRMKSI